MAKWHPHGKPVSELATWPCEAPEPYSYQVRGGAVPKTSDDASETSAMNISSAFIKRPVATSLLTAALLLAGAMACLMLPVAPLPQVAYPTIQVTVTLPGASPETMASSVATPLERMFGRIAGITEMTSNSQMAH